MEFWGVEVKPGEPLKIKPEVSMLIHISQAAMDEVKNGKGPNKVHLRLKIDDKVYVIGTLSAEDRPQILFDLVLHKEFELSHDWKDGSLYLAGYIADDESYGEGFSDEDEDNQVESLQNGKLEPMKPATGKAALVKSKPLEKSMSKHAKLKKDKSTSNEDDDDSNDDEESELEEDSYSLEHLIGDDSDEVDDDDDDESDDDDGSEDDDQDLVSHKPVQKRPSKTAIESLVPAAKKAKLAASEKSGGKTSATNGKLKEHNPKSGSQISSKSNSKTLTTNNAVHPNKKAKRTHK